MFFLFLHLYVKVNGRTLLLDKHLLFLNTSGIWWALVERSAFWTRSLDEINGALKVLSSKRVLFLCICKVTPRVLMIAIFHWFYWTRAHSEEKVFFYMKLFTYFWKKIFSAKIMSKNQIILYIISTLTYIN